MIKIIVPVAISKTIPKIINQVNVASVWVTNMKLLGEPTTVNDKIKPSTTVGIITKKSTF